MRSKTFRDYLKEIDIDANNKHLCQGIENKLSAVILYILYGENEDSFSKNLINHVDDDEIDILSKIFLKRVINLKNMGVIKDDVFKESTAIFVTYLKLDNPDKVIIFLIDILETIYLQGKPVNLKNVLEIYPYGFYNQKTFIKIIDEVMKKDDKPFKYDFIY